MINYLNNYSWQKYIKRERERESDDDGEWWWVFVIFIYKHKQALLKHLIIIQESPILIPVWK